MDQMLAAGLPQVVTLGGTALPLAGRARVYASGITPYDVTHLGHAATFVWVDTLARVLHADGTEVIVCRNVTDVDDVLLAAAGRSGSRYDEFAVIQQFYFDQDMTALGIRQPALQPGAHAYIGQVIALAAGLLTREAAYQRDGQVYFRGAAAARRAGLDRQAAPRLAAEYGDHPDDARKDDPFDVALWQASDGDQPAWQSPWGPGRPGWHAGCAAMALHTFGPAVDVPPGAAICVSPTTPTRLRSPRRSPGSPRSPARGFRPAWSVSPGPRWPNPPATLSWSETSSGTTPRGPSGC